MDLERKNLDPEFLREAERREREYLLAQLAFLCPESHTDYEWSLGDLRAHLNSWIEKRPE